MSRLSELARDLYWLVAVFGLVPAVRLGGLPVLAAGAFAAVGAVGALQLERAGLPIGGAVLAAVAIGGVGGALTGLLVARSAPPFVALATWALSWLAYTALVGFPSLAGGEQGLTRPALDTVETPLGLTLTLTPRVHAAAAALLCAATYAAAAWFARGRAGQEASAARDDRELAASLGIPARRVELLAAAGAACAAAGAGVALLLGVAAPADFSPLLALQLFAAALAATRHPLLGVAVVAALPHAADWLTAALLLAAVAVRGRPSASARREPAAARPELPRTDRGLDARDLRVTLGGRPVLRGLDLAVRPGEIHALIGPNGSGKTTALRELGVTRTLQCDADFPALTPHQQLALLDDGLAWTLLDLIGLPGHTAPATPGERRLLGVARATATGAPVLALDEPAAGMTAAERATLADVLRALAAAGRALLVVEHDLRLVAATADVVTVLDEGAAIAHGTPADVIADAAVRRVYLGAAA